MYIYMQKWNFYKERRDPLLRISRYLRILHPYIFSFKLCVIAYIRLSNPLLSIDWLVTARWEEQLSRAKEWTRRGEIRNIIWTDDNSLRYRWNTRAWRPGFRSLIQLNRFARNGLRSISTAGGRDGWRYHTVATVFFTLRKRASRLAWPSINGEWVTSCWIWTSFFEPFVLRVCIFPFL